MHLRRIDQGGERSGLGKGGGRVYGWKGWSGGVAFSSIYIWKALPILSSLDGVCGSRVEEGRERGGQKKKFESDFLSSFHFFSCFF